MKRRTMMTGTVAVLAIGFLSFLIPSTGADYTATSQGQVQITVVIPQPATQTQDTSESSEADTAIDSPTRTQQQAPPADVQPAQPVASTVDDAPVASAPSQEEAVNTEAPTEAAVNISDSSDYSEQKEVHEDPDVPEE